MELMDKFFSERVEKKRLEERFDFLRDALEGIKDYVEEIKHQFEKEIIKLKSEEGKKTSPEVDMLRAQLDAAYKKIEELTAQLSALSETLEKKERARLEAEIKTLKAEQRALLDKLEETRRAMTVGGFQSDTYRLISQLVGEAGSRRPLESALRVLFPEKFPGGPLAPRTSQLPPELEAELKSAGILETAEG